jgi:hypothetical protein
MHRLLALLPLVIALGLPAAARAEGEIYTLAGEAGFTLHREGRPGTHVAVYTNPPIAALAGGGFVYGEGTRVWRVDPQGLVHRAAGNDRYGTAGDGGPALEATVEVDHLAGLPDGGFLIADGDHNRVRKVDARGIITTVAGGGRLRGDGVPATRAHFDFITAIAAAPDDGFIVVDDFDRVRRVGPDGLIRTIAGNGRDESLPPPHGEPATSDSVYVDDVAVTPDGSVLIADRFEPRVLRVAPDGALTIFATLPARTDHPRSLTVAPDGSVLLLTLEPRPLLWRLAPDGGAPQVIAFGGPFTLSAPDGMMQLLPGESGQHWPPGLVEDVDAMPDGGALLSTGADGANELAGYVDYLAPTTPRVLAAALLRTRDRVIGPESFASVSLTLPATVKLTVAGRSTTAQLPAGVSRVRLPRVPANRPHRLWLAASAPDGRGAYDATRLYPPGWLPQVTAEMLAERVARHVVKKVDEDGSLAFPCRRFAANRVDCILHGDKRSDCGAAAISLAGHHVRWGAYGCRLQAHPRYAHRPRPISRRDADCRRDGAGCLAGRVDEAALLPSS